MSDREELVLLLREIMRWEKRTRNEIIKGIYERVDEDSWNVLADILNRAHVAISTDTRNRVRQRLQKPVLTAR